MKRPLFLRLAALGLAAITPFVRGEVAFIRNDLAAETQGALREHSFLTQALATRVVTQLNARGNAAWAERQHARGVLVSTPNQEVIKIHMNISGATSEVTVRDITHSPLMEVDLSDAELAAEARKMFMPSDSFGQIEGDRLDKKFRDYERITQFGSEEMVDYIFHETADRRITQFASRANNRTLHRDVDDYFAFSVTLLKELRWAWIALRRIDVPLSTTMLLAIFEEVSKAHHEDPLITDESSLIRAIHWLGRQGFPIIGVLGRWKEWKTDEINVWQAKRGDMTEEVVRERIDLLMNIYFDSTKAPPDNMPIHRAGNLTKLVEEAATFLKVPKDFLLTGDHPALPPLQRPLTKGNTRTSEADQSYLRRFPARLLPIHALLICLLQNGWINEEIRALFGINENDLSHLISSAQEAQTQKDTINGKLPVSWGDLYKQRVMLEEWLQAAERLRDSVLEPLYAFMDYSIPLRQLALNGLAPWPASIRDWTEFPDRPLLDVKILRKLHRIRNRLTMNELIQLTHELAMDRVKGEEAKQWAMHIFLRDWQDLTPIARNQMKRNLDTAVQKGMIRRDEEIAMIRPMMTTLCIEETQTPSANSFETQLRKNVSEHLAASGKPFVPLEIIATSLAMDSKTLRSKIQTATGLPVEAFSLIPEHPTEEFLQSASFALRASPEDMLLTESVAALCGKTENQLCKWAQRRTQQLHLPISGALYLSETFYLLSSTKWANCLIHTDGPPSWYERAVIRKLLPQVAIANHCSLEDLGTREYDATPPIRVPGGYIRFTGFSDIMDRMNQTALPKPYFILQRYGIRSGVKPMEEMRTVEDLKTALLAGAAEFINWDKVSPAFIRALVNEFANQLGKPGEGIAWISDGEYKNIPIKKLSNLRPGQQFTLGGFYKWAQLKKAENPISASKTTSLFIAEWVGAVASSDQGANAAQRLKSKSDLSLVLSKGWANVIPWDDLQQKVVQELFEEAANQPDAQVPVLQLQSKHFLVNLPSLNIFQRTTNDVLENSLRSLYELFYKLKKTIPSAALRSLPDFISDFVWTTEKGLWPLVSMKQKMNGNSQKRQNGTSA